jgi:hypothetical protein
VAGITWTSQRAVAPLLGIHGGLHRRIAAGRTGGGATFGSVSVDAGMSFELAPGLNLEPQLRLRLELRPDDLPGPPQLQPVWVGQLGLGLSWRAGARRP